MWDEESWRLQGAPAGSRHRSLRGMSSTGSLCGQASEGFGDRMQGP